MTPSLLLVIAALTIQPAAAATRAAYPNVSKPHSLVGKAFNPHARLGTRPNIVRMNIPNYFLSDAKKTIELEYDRVVFPALLDNKNRILIDGFQSIALLPENPKPGDSVTILSKSRQFGRYPAKTERLSAQSLKKLERALKRLNNGDFQDVPAVQKVLDRHFDGIRSPVAASLSDMNPDHFAVIRGPVDHGQLWLWEKKLKPKQVHHIILSLGHNTSRSIDIQTSHYPAKYGWKDSHYRLSRAMTSRSRELRRVAKVLKNAVEAATRTRSSPKVERILRRLRALVRP